MIDYCLLYRSIPVAMWEQVDEILLTALRHNEAAGITGVLEASPGRYLQWIEGPWEAVSALYDRIRADPRHHAVELIAAGPLEVVARRPHRLFRGWSMGLRIVDEVPESLDAFLRAYDEAGG